MWNLFEEFLWLYRGVPAESPEVSDVEFFDEIYPLRPERIGEEWREMHSAGMTQTGYKSWSTDRSFAEEAARECSAGEGLSGQIRMFKVRIDSLDYGSRVRGKSG